MIEVEIHDRDSAPVAPSLSDGVHHAIPEQQPVGKSGERVVVGLILELLLRGLALGDVAIVDHERAHGRIGQQILGEAFQPDPRAVLVQEPEFGARFERGTGGQQVSEYFQRGLPVTRMDQGDEAASHQLFVAVAEKTLRR